MPIPPTPPNESPRPGKVTDQIIGAMVTKEPVPPLGWAIARRDDGRPLYLVAVVMGSENIAEFEQALQKIKPHMKPVDTFEESEPKPPPPPDQPRPKRQK